MPEYCVTGGTGFIAAYLVKSLLEKGHTVRITVGFLQEFDGARERLKIFKADLLEEGSFDEAVQGVDGVFHTAAPVLVPYSDRIQETLIDPCIKGTQNVLNSCLKASSVKRVVFTSSSSTVRYRDDLPQIFYLNESHWSDIEYCKRHNLWYAYAKTVAEKEAWRISKENGMGSIYCRIYLSGSRGEYPNMAVGFTHVDDVVAGNILAMENSKATGRLVCSGPVAHWSQIIKMLRAKYPSYPYENKCSSQEGDNIPHSMDTTKIARLGLPPFKTLEQMFDDCIRSLQEKGFL
ncbi:oxidoreductase family protein [Salix suchowensis]|nr:oxidoreductase family protein [Salix suchowensis]